MPGDKLTLDALYRLAILEEFAEKASMDYLHSFIGPKLDNLQFDMVDTGKSRSGMLTGQNSFSSSRGSRSDSPDVWSTSSPSKSSVSNPRKRFPLRRKKKKNRQTAGCELCVSVSRIQQSKRHLHSIIKCAFALSKQAQGTTAMGTCGALQAAVSG